MADWAMIKIKITEVYRVADPKAWLRNDPVPTVPSRSRSVEALRGDKTWSTFRKKLTRATRVADPKAWLRSDPEPPVPSRSSGCLLRLKEEWEALTVRRSHCEKSGRKEQAGADEGEQDCEERHVATRQAVGCASRVQEEGSSSKVKKTDQDSKGHCNRRKEKDSKWMEQRNNARPRAGTWMGGGHYSWRKIQEGRRPKLRTRGGGRRKSVDIWSLRRRVSKEMYMLSKEGYKVLDNTRPGANIRVIQKAVKEHLGEMGTEDLVTIQGGGNDLEEIGGKETVWWMEEMVCTMASSTTAVRKQPSSDGGHGVLGNDSSICMRQQSLIPDNLEDEVEMVEHFVEEFKHRYGGSHLPAFKKDTLENVILKAKNCSPREKKPLAIYMHHDRNENFCSEVLCSNSVAAYLNGNFVVWGWDLTSSKQIHRVIKPIREYVSYSLSMKIKDAGDNQLPLLLTICCTSWGPEVLSYIYSTSCVSDVMNCLMINKMVFDDNLSTELQKLEELECKRTASWSIPWKCETDATLEPSKEHKAKLRLEEKQQKEVEETRKKELVQAISSGDMDTIQKIHDQGGDLTILVQAVHQGNVIWCLVTQAAHNGHTHLLLPLLDAGLSVDGNRQENSHSSEKHTTSWTPLIVAARQGHVRMIEELLFYGANPLAKDQQGATALHHAAFCGHVTCVDVLISCTPTTITDNSGRTPVHAACLRGHLPVIKLLAESGWKLDVVDEEGNTALHLSAWYGSLEVVKYLYKADSKINPYKKNSERLTPFDYAVREGHHHVEKWFMKVRGSHSMDLTHTQYLIKSQNKYSEDLFKTAKMWLSADNIEGIANLCFINDPHWMDKNGMTILHLAVTETYCSLLCTAKLLDGIIHPHVVTLEGFTPLDLARLEFKKSGFNRQRKIIKILEEHQCPKEDGSPEELYEKLLTIISEGDSVEAVSHLLCAGAPMELVGNFPNSALQLAITNDCPRIVSILLASGASLTPRTEGLNLLQQAWYSANTTSKVFCAINNAFSRQLKRERDRLPRHTKGLREDLAKLIASIDGDKPWEACWQSGRTMAKLTSFMVTAVRANCPLTAGFLQWAGAGAFFSASRKTTPLHAALEEGNLSLTETLIRDLGASLYIPDARDHFPKDISNMTPALLDKLERQMYEREQRHLEALKEHKKDESEKQMVQAVLDLQKELFNKHTTNSTDAIFSGIGALNDNVQETVAYALLVASRSGLQQLLYLMLTVAHLPADLVVDVTSNTTALHEAAAHGKSGCIALLLSILNNAARAMGIILGRVMAFDDTYKGRLELVGSTRDGSKLFAPDEFDINIVIPAADRVSVSMHQELDESVRYQVIGDYPTLFIMGGKPRQFSQTPRSSRRSPRAPSALEQVQTEAIASLQQQLATRPAHHPAAPRSSAPENCDVEMSTAAFRSWRWAPAEAVLHIRLHCTPPLQRSLDARFTAGEWQALTVEEALDDISRITLLATNQAADWCKLFTANQEHSESISEYFARCETFHDADSLRKFCAVFEAAYRDAAFLSFGGNFRQETTAVAAVTPLPGAPQDELAPPVAATRRQPSKPRCGNCGTMQKPGRGSCPAGELACFNCGKTGHLRSLCKSRTKKAAAAEDLETSGIVIAATGKAQSQPYIWVTVSDTRKEGKSARIQVVPDTGSSVCGGASPAGNAGHRDGVTSASRQIARRGKCEPQAHGRILLHHATWQQGHNTRRLCHEDHLPVLHLTSLQGSGIDTR
ncbi:hypothetical protein O3P69_014690 [Scylla paramamosain]|uniref:CCHC-type domain-containing protein n=1 Tax=Scylla paramamosain TaxID=85552 RepID=A0AAW0U272_SCYPA